MKLEYPKVVKITYDQDGTKIIYAKWCYVDHACGDSVALCSGQYFGLGASSAKFETKQGRITCPECLNKIRQYKKVKL